VPTQAQTGPGYDSELLALAKLLDTQGLEARPGDTLRSFLLQHIDPDIDGVRAERLLALHYRYRFARDGLSPAEREELREGSNANVSRYEGL